MIDISRRFFLGGALSLVAAATSAMPSLIGNMPQIWGDGRHDDSDGIGALFRNEPVVFTPDRLTVDAHSGITFHDGTFCVSRTIDIPAKCQLVMDCPKFRARGLPLDAPFFRASIETGEQFAPGNMARVWFLAPWDQAPYIEYPKFDGEADFEAEMLSLARSRVAAA